MAARPGEDVAAVLFADVHYFYGPPTVKPSHHRFDKGSYVYLFENAQQRRARIEIANNAGTPDQDAFTGFLDGTHVQYSYKHSTLVTLTINGPNGRQLAPADAEEWHLPTYDPKNENKYMYKLNTVDIYFWTKEDATQFVNGIRRVLPQQQLTIQDEPVSQPPPHQEAMSSVVQQLENVAITDPSYQHGQTRNSETSITSFPGPPISAPPQSHESTNFAPIAYNPAAPAAPETIQHREKTPPPEDGAANPLMAAATSDQGQFFVPTHPTQQSYGFPGPPSHQPHQYQQQFTGPPAPPASAPVPAAPVQSPFVGHFQHSFAPPPTAPMNQPPPVTPTAPPAYQQQAPPPGQSAPVTQYTNYPISPGIQRAVTTPSLYSPGFAPGPPTPGFNGPPNPNHAPPGGFSQYQYQKMNTGISGTQPLMTDYSIHQQLYRPTESEALGKHSGKQKELSAPTGRLEKRAGQLEKGVGSLFKKLEKKIG